MNIGTWFNVYVFDRWEWLERRRQWVYSYLYSEMYWRFSYLITGKCVAVIANGTFAGMPLTLVQPHSRFSRRRK